MRAILHKIACAGVTMLALMATVARADEPKGMPKFKQAWELEVPADTVRIATADVMGDKKYHLLTLGKDGILTIHDVTGDKPKEAGKVELGEKVEEFVAGSFLKDKPAVIVIEGAYFVRGTDGKYTKTLKNTLRPINGYVHPYDRTETVFSSGLDNKPKEFLFAAKGEKIEVSESDKIAVNLIKGDYQLTAVRIPKKQADIGPLPEGVKRGGVNIMVDKSGEAASLLTLFVEGEKTSLCLYDFIAMQNGVNPDTIKPAWIGGEIKGKVLDFFVGTSPKDVKQMGAFILTETGDAPKKRMVTFYAKE